MDIQDVINISTWIIAVASFVVSILSPWIVEKTKNKHEIKIWNREFLEKHRCDVIESYLNAVGEYAYCPSLQNREKFGKAVSEIFMYAPQELWSEIEEINSAITNKSTDASLQQKYLDLCKSFSSLKRSKI